MQLTQQTNKWSNHMTERTHIPGTLNLSYDGCKFGADIRATVHKYLHSYQSIWLLKADGHLISSSASSIIGYLPLTAVINTFYLFLTWLPYFSSLISFIIATSRQSRRKMYGWHMSLARLMEQWSRPLVMITIHTCQPFLFSQFFLPWILPFTCLSLSLKLWSHGSPWKRKFEAIGDNRSIKKFYIWKHLVLRTQNIWYIKTFLRMNENAFITTLFGIFSNSFELHKYFLCRGVNLMQTSVLNISWHQTNHNVWCRDIFCPMVGRKFMLTLVQNVLRHQTNLNVHQLFPCAHIDIYACTHHS